MAMQEVDVDTELKVIIVGNGQVGKTSMITRFAKGEWTNSYKKTIGTDFMEKDVFVKQHGESVQLLLWDTAGQEMFSELTRNYYKGAGAVVYVFSTIDRESFLAIENWQRKVEEQCGSIVSVLVQNKIDLLDEAAVSSEEVEELARRMRIRLYRTCVKDNILVDDVFNFVAQTFLDQGGQSSLSEAAVPSIGDVGRRSTANSGGASSGSGANRAAQPKKETAQAFRLEPSKRRTGGKKNCCS